MAASGPSVGRARSRERKRERMSRAAQIRRALGPPPGPPPEKPLAELSTSGSPCYASLVLRQTKTSPKAAPGTVRAPATQTACDHRETSRDSYGQLRCDRCGNSLEPPIPPPVPRPPSPWAREPILANDWGPGPRPKADDSPTCRADRGGCDDLGIVPGGCPVCGLGSEDKSSRRP